MGETEIIKYLKRTGRKDVTIPELCCVMKINRTNISRAVRKMRERKEIKVKMQKKGCFTRQLISL